MYNHFQRQNQPEREREVQRECRAHARRTKRRRRAADRKAAAKQQEQHRQDKTIGITTQNVRGLATHVHNIGHKLQGFKEQHMRRSRDVILIQETHLLAGENDIAARQYSATIFCYVGLQAFHRSEPLFLGVG
jgi:hypothetical protein